MKMDNATPEEAAEWAAIIPNVDEGVEPKLFEKQDLLSAFDGEVTITVRKALNLTGCLLGEITRLCDAQTAAHPGKLNRIDPEALMMADGIFAFATRANLVVAVAYAERCLEAGQTALHVSHVVSDGSRRGIGLPMIAALFLGEANSTGKEAHGAAEVRILPNGTVNSSCKTFARLGFWADEYFTHPVTLRNPQKAIAGSAEPNGDPLKYLRLEGKADEVADRSRLALENWSVEFGQAQAADE
ncbi:hypothetical protein [Leisingera aquaemixtae]|uniref:N-acetyltransferase domain-containing protein n=1 Tax=Leisingera aquaemixtae TaxID=1396826 RepID=A0A0P1HDT7_9RHOB|nr:hypothetical protein [Leisingera aquaemixtae]CUI01884.1 hypothetical protein PHA8399_04033 [Leisingera aquaemixtae]